MADKTRIVVGVSIDTSQKTVAKLQSQLDQIAKKLTLNISKANLLGKALQNTTTTSKVTTGSKSITTELNNQYDASKKLKGEIDKLKQAEDARINSYIKYSEKKIKQLQKESAIADDIADRAQKYAIKQGSVASAQQGSLTNRLSGMIIGKENVLDKFPELRTQYKLLEDDIIKFGQTGSKSYKQITNDLGKFNNNLRRSSLAFKKLNEGGYKFGEMVKLAAKKVAIWSLSTSLIYIPLNAFKEGIQVIIDLDKSLTELNKVTDESASSMKRFVDQAYDAGNKLARTGKEVIDATTVFARAGYTLKEAFDLSQQALLLSNIGDGMDNVSETASELIAVMKGYSLSIEDVAHVVDILNEVSNNFAVDTNNLTDGLQRASGTLAMTGTTVEQLTGILTGSYEVLRNMEKSSTGLVTISQRLRGNLAPYVQKCA